MVVRALPATPGAGAAATARYCYCPAPLARARRFASPPPRLPTGAPPSTSERPWHSATIRARTERVARLGDALQLRLAVRATLLRGLDALEQPLLRNPTKSDARRVCVFVCVCVRV